MSNERDDMKFFTLGNIGLVTWAICTDLPKDKAIAYANRMNPTGISSKWVLSKDKFPHGEANPHGCSDNPGSKHFLLEC